MKAKKILAAFIAATMVLSTMSFTAFANEGTETPVAANWIDSADTAWYTETIATNADATEFTIDTAEELAGLAKLVNDGNDTFDGKKVTLTHDINLENKDWTPIGINDSAQFKGEFNGGDYTISNMTFTTILEYAGLFGSTSNAYLHNLKLDEISFSGTTETAVFVGSLVGYVYKTGVIDDVRVTNLTMDLTAPGNSIGGLVGYTYDGNIKNSSVDGATFNITSTSTTSNGLGIGGLIGQGRGLASYTSDYTGTEPNPVSVYTYSKCSVANVSFNVSGTFIMVGGFIAKDGYSHWSNSATDCEVTNLTVTCAADDGQYVVGGFMGQQSGLGGGDNTAGTDLNPFANCSTAGTITSNGTNVNSIFGGFMGIKNGRGATIKDATTDVDVTVAAGNVGGFAGGFSQHSQNVYRFIDCTANGDVSTQNGIAGGFIGATNVSDGGTTFNVTLDGVKCYGSVSSANSTASGLWGQFNLNNDPSTVHIKTNCVAATDVSGNPTISIVKLSKEYYLDGTEGDEYSIKKAAAYVTDNKGDDVGYKTLEEALATGANNATLLDDTIADFTVNTTETFVLNLDHVSDTYSWNSQLIKENVSLTGKVTVPEGTILTIKGARKDNAIELVAPEKIGYTFAGWYADEAYQKAVANNIVTAPAANGTTYYPKWTYEVEFNGNGAEGTMEAQTITVGDTTTTLTANGFTAPEGKTFKGWNTQADGNGKTYAEGTAVSEIGKDTTLYAIWGGAEYDITYVLNNGENPADAPNKHIYGVVTKLPVPQQEGYIFTGWYTTETFDADTKVAKLSKDGYTENIILYASWKKAEYATAIEVQFVKDETDTYGKTYDIVLSAVGDFNINRLSATDLTFNISNAEGNRTNVSYDIIPKANSDVTPNPLTIDPLGETRIDFHFNGEGKADSGVAKSVTIGQVKFDGYGKFKFNVDETATTLVAHAATDVDNIVTSFIVGGDVDATTGELVINDNVADEKGIIDTEFETKKYTLTVNVAFNNALSADTTDAYKAMKISISGGDLETPITDELLTIVDGVAAEYTIELSEKEKFTVTVAGEGYRTATYTVNMQDSDKTLNFWNNVSSSKIEVEEGKNTSEKYVTFLAGDIVKDNNINIYDLSAVVSYFGEIGVNDPNANALKKGYVKYDLNRDGMIDSKDVAMVLVSWNK